MAHEHRLEVYRGNGRVDNVLGEDTQITTMTAAMTVGIWDKISVSLALPVIRTEYRILRHQTPDGMPLPYFEEVEQGFADSTLTIDYTLTNGATHGADSWLSIGVSIPTGEERDYPQLSGRDFGEVLTLGTGTWDPIIIHGLSVNEGTRRWYGGLMARLTPYENRFGYQGGSVFQTWVGAAQQVGETGVSAHLRFGYRHQWRARREGLAVLNSGGDWVSAMPALEWAVADDVTLKAAVDVTLWRDLYAAADDVDQPVNGQTDPDYRWFFSVSYEGGQ